MKRCQCVQTVSFRKDVLADLHVPSGYGTTTHDSCQKGPYGGGEVSSREG